MKNKKIFVLIPDGIGLRNFAYSNFNDLGNQTGLEMIYWNNTPFNLKKLDLQEIKINNSKTHPFTDVLKNSRKAIELNLNIKKFNDNVYDSYRFPQSYKTIKTFIKNVSSNLLTAFFSNESGLVNIRKLIKNQERKTNYYQSCIETLKTEKPDLVFCTNQRPVLAIAPILAAQDLKIPTATFIFSWDNLPKATMVIETDFYFVWSELMKEELIKYYPYIDENQIFVTGTPQFENHFNMANLLTKEDFFRQNKLDISKEYICFSGDDQTTSPADPSYLDDFAQSITNLNTKGHQLGIIFRKCPVDFSGRYDSVLKKYNDLIVPIDPKWGAIGTEWNTVLPTIDDNFLLSNTIKHSIFVVNIGSSMVFDYISFNKPCCYFNYNQKTDITINWNIHTCYKYVHFRSMPNKEAVVWFDSLLDIENKVEMILKNHENTTKNAKKWFEIINEHPPQNASKRILNGIKTIID
ncbi:MAG: UDP-glycosyltransferase [Flavobacterium sp.]|nr:UDP-glycosyltransferase [Flavobacterium sp.]